MHSFIRDGKGVVLLEMKTACSCKCWKGHGMIKKVTECGLFYEMNR
jgi:hypothetical protein